MNIHPSDEAPQFDEPLEPPTFDENPIGDSEQNYEAIPDPSSSNWEDPPADYTGEQVQDLGNQFESMEVNEQQQNVIVSVTFDEPQVEETNPEEENQQEYVEFVPPAPHVTEIEYHTQFVAAKKQEFSISDVIYEKVDLSEIQPEAEPEEVP